jgi:glycosyltransferase involved in cell wall biosynthesis
MLEAMACGCVVVGSATPPVQEMVRHGENGLLVKFHDHEALAKTVAKVLANPKDYMHLRQSARQTVVDRYDLHSVCLPKQIDMINRLLRGEIYPAEPLRPPAELESILMNGV